MNTGRYQEELTRTLSNIRVHESSAIEAGFAKNESLFNQLGKLTVFYRYLVDRGTANQAPFGVQILYAKISNCLVSTEILLRAGYAGPAAMVLRSLFEAAIHLELILEKDVVARSKLFVDYQHIEAQSTFAISKQPQKIREAHRKALGEVRSAYRPKQPRSWCWQIVKSKRPGKGGEPNNPTLRDICEHLGKLKYYDQIYGKVSIAVHPVPSYASIIQREGKDRILELGPLFTGMISAIGDLAIVYGTLCFLEVLKFLNPPDVQHLSLYLRKELNLLLPAEVKHFVKR